MPVSKKYLVGYFMVYIGGLGCGWFLLKESPRSTLPMGRLTGQRPSLIETVGDEKKEDSPVAVAVEGMPVTDDTSAVTGDLEVDIEFIVQRKLELIHPVSLELEQRIAERFGLSDKQLGAINAEIHEHVRGLRLLERESATTVTKDNGDQWLRIEPNSNVQNYAADFRQKIDRITGSARKGYELSQLLTVNHVLGGGGKFPQEISIQADAREDGETTYRLQRRIYSKSGEESLAYSSMNLAASPILLEAYRPLLGE